MYILDKNSFFVIEHKASLTLAPMLVPALKICLDITYSLLLFANLYID